jgi:cell division transport system permease protein
MLDREADRASAEAVQDQIENWSQIDAVRLVSREQALSEFGEQTGLATLLASLDRNPLPHTLRVLPRLPAHDSALNHLIGELESLPNVTRVVADTRWMSRLEETLVAGERWVLALGGAMILGAILALANTLHLAIDARREEILVVRVIGGSPAFVRRPFLYTGLYFGVGGGVLAALMLWALSLWLTGPVNALFLLYDSPGQLQGPGLVYPLALILLGAIIGWLVSWAAAEHYFRQLETR